MADIAALVRSPLSPLSPPSSSSSCSSSSSSDSSMAHERRKEKRMKRWRGERREGGSTIRSKRRRCYEEDTNSDDDSDCMDGVPEIAVGKIPTDEGVEVVVDDGTSSCSNGNDGITTANDGGTVTTKKSTCGVEDGTVVEDGDEGDGAGDCHRSRRHRHRNRCRRRRRTDDSSSRLVTMTKKDLTRLMDLSEEMDSILSKYRSRNRIAKSMEG